MLGVAEQITQESPVILPQPTKTHFNGFEKLSMSANTRHRAVNATKMNATWDLSQPHH
jgi:hypothetical protein